MVIYNCFRHGRIRVEYLEIGDYGDVTTVAPCPGGDPAHSMTLETPKASVDQRLKDAHQIAGRIEREDEPDECGECGTELDDDGFCGICGMRYD